MSSNSVDLAFQRQRWLWADQIQTAPTPTTLILVSAGTWSGVLQDGLPVRNTCRLQDVNPANTVPSNGFPATYGHYFTTEATRYLFDLTDGSVYDLSAYNSQTLIVVWPNSF